MTTDLNIADDLELYMLDLINAARAQEGLDALLLEQHLNASAEAHSLWMLEADVFSHTGVAGSSAHERIVDAGFDLAGRWWTGENLSISTVDSGAYFDEVDAMFLGLMNSPGHRANILNVNYDYVGIGIEVDWFNWSQAGLNSMGDRLSIVATQNFGTTGGTVLLDNGPTLEPLPEPEPQPPVVEDLELTGDDTDNELSGGEGHDQIFGLRGDDHLSGGGGDDIIKGGIGNDTIYGGSDNDTLIGGSGNDLITGGSGINKLVGQSGSDELHGGGERDILNGGGQDDLLYGYDGNDRAKGGGGDDEVYGGNGPDKLFGNNGSDSLFGGSGDDLLNGGGLADWLESGAGDDRIKGGEGADFFVFAEGADIDRIVDFAIGEDTLLIHSSDWGAGESAEQLLDAHANVEGDRIVIDFGSGDQIVLQDIATLDGLAASIDMY